MDGHNDSIQDPDSKGYKSRPGALAWFFRESRDGWKRKYRDLKGTVKGLKVRVADLTRSREQWRAKAEQASERLGVLEAENAELRARFAEAEDKKKRATTPAR
jgi:predicted nuclease with TOPRIM domain